MKIQLMDNPGHEDDPIRRGDAIAAAADKEGLYPASLWYVPPVVNGPVPLGLHSLIHFIEPMRIPTITQQEHEIGVNRRTRKSYIYDGMELKQARMSFRAHLARHAPEEQISGPISLTVTWLFEAGQNHKNMEYKTTRPDTDNLIKMLKDEMAHCGFFKNDAQVAVEINRKLWVQNLEGIIVDIAELPEVAVL